MLQTTISPDYPFQSNFVEVLGSGMHYIDQGQGDPILFLHGNPTSSYLWRNVIPHLTGQGRCIAPDLIGMGKSDKPDLEYRLRDHIRYLDGFIQALDLKNILLVIHDWGSALGFHYAARHEANVRGVAFMEAIVSPIPSWEMMSHDFQAIFRRFRTRDEGWQMIVDNNFFIEKILPASVVRVLSDEEMDRYREPFVEPAHRKPVWRWPNEIPIEGEPPDVVEIVGNYKRWLTETGLPKLLITAQPGAIMTPPLIEWCKDRLANLRVVNIGQGIHFIQEDNPDGIGREIAAWAAGLESSDG